MTAFPFTPYPVCLNPEFRGEERKGLHIDRPSSTDKTRRQSLHSVLFALGTAYSRDLGKLIPGLCLMNFLVC